MKKSFLIFVLIGIGNTVNNWIFSAIFSWLLPPDFAYALGYLMALTIGFFLNCRFTFHQPPGLIRFGKYALSYVPNYLIGQGVVWVCLHIWGWHALACYAAAAVVGLPVTYLILKIFAFAKGDTR